MKKKSEKWQFINTGICRIIEKGSEKRESCKGIAFRRALFFRLFKDKFAIGKEDYAEEHSSEDCLKFLMGQYNEIDTSQRMKVSGLPNRAVLKSWADWCWMS